MFAKIENTYEFTLTRNIKVLYDHHFNQQGKAQNRLKLFIMAHISIDRKYLQYIVQDIQFLIFYVAHYVITV